MRFPIEMYKIRQEEVKIKIPCERCMNSGIVDRSCKKCGGNGVHNKTIKVWKVAPKTETVVNIDRSSKDSFYKGIQTSYEGGLRYWTGMNEFYKEEDKYLHFTKKDAQDECNRRNKDVADILKVDSNNKTNLYTPSIKIDKVFVDKELSRTACYVETTKPIPVKPVDYSQWEKVKDVELGLSNDK